MTSENSNTRKAARLAIVEEHVAREDRYGHDGVRAYYADLFAGFPDFSFGVERRHIAEETIILRLTVLGQLGVA